MPLPLIHDDNYQQFVQPPPGFSRGLLKRDFSLVPQGFCARAPSFNLPIIPRDQWSDLIKQMTAEKSRLSDIRRAKLHAQDQGQTEYCWCYATCNTLRVQRAVNNDAFVELSPASVAAQVKGFRNQGGNGIEALDWIADHGIATTQFWPNQAINRKYVTADMQANALLHRFGTYLDLEPGNFDQLMTCGFLRIPVSIGLDWWGHQVTFLDPIEISPGKFGGLIDNSWGDDWGDMGMGQLTESKLDFSEGIAPLSPTAVDQ